MTHNDNALLSQLMSISPKALSQMATLVREEQVEVTKILGEVALQAMMASPEVHGLELEPDSLSARLRRALRSTKAVDAHVLTEKFWLHIAIGVEGKAMRLVSVDPIVEGATYHLHANPHMIV